MDIENRARLHLVELEIINYFIGICDQLNLKYFALGGTLLGAVRHQDFIPWDDDVDFGMPRPDYEKLCDFLINNNNKEFTFKNFKNSDIKTYFSRIECKKAKIIDNSAEQTDIRYSWIDIFPLDGMPTNKFKMRLHQFNLLRLRLLLQYSQFSEIVNVNLTERPLIEKIFIQIGKIIKPEHFLDTRKLMFKLDKCLKKYQYNNSENVVNFMGAYKFKEMFPKKVYKELTQYDFNSIKLCGPKDYDKVLKQMYGASYMLPPSKMVMNKHFTKIVFEDNKNN
ncbi:LicD family protein [Pediococcus acidilactici]|uniref:LicD family protein n=3 Tax=Pediococcus acidilactici TaxID=1254 RepID=UPI000FFCD685|nr:LicD family protein [Pediococcus acidilactici]KAF0493154.1 LicD family protein [Pediococcus acidilactici]MCJ2192754.1 LicD family protein [Pediococcus acidilactici]MCJ2387011.1 LicD family protein [Pediococcus acidilactici]MDM5041840.1 LicD family protein [Pediococcus acidilactici]MDV2603864.1 LicD family protein [Pediococcus acidilactici]